jgi:hypothetical protein
MQWLWGLCPEGAAQAGPVGELSLGRMWLRGAWSWQLSPVKAR